MLTGLTTTNADIKGLHPRLDYLFRIRAWNEYGCSEPSLPVSLHRPIGRDLAIHEDVYCVFFELSCHVLGTNLKTFLYCNYIVEK